jgi:hypothetical protein
MLVQNKDPWIVSLVVLCLGALVSETPREDFYVRQDA